MNTILRRRILSERMGVIKTYSNVLLFVEINGNITAAGLHDALDIAEKKYPLLRSKVIIDDNGDAWFTNDDVPEFDTPEYTIIEGMSREQIADIEIRHSFDVHRGPLIRFGLIRHNNSTEFFVNASHILADARSILMVMNDIFQCIFGNPAEVIQNPSNPPLSAADARSIDLQPTLDIKCFPCKVGTWKERIQIGFLNFMWKRKKETFTQSDIEKLNLLYLQKHNLKYFTWSMSSEETDRFTNRCKAEGITITSALCTAFLNARAYGKPGEEFANYLALPVDLRNYLRPQCNDAWGKYSSYLDVMLPEEISAEKDFWHNARVVHRHIRGRFTDKNLFRALLRNLVHPSLVDAITFAQYGMCSRFIPNLILKIEKVAQKAKSSFIVSNLGAVKFPECINGSVLNMQVLAYHDVHERCFCILSVGGKLYINLVFDERLVSSETMHRYKETIARMTQGN